MRSGASRIWRARGIFRTTRAARRRRSMTPRRRARAPAGDPRDYEAFMRLAVRSRKNILVSGPTGSGKTTWTKALIREIPPDERLITIEDAQELVLDRHPNHVRLFYSKDDQGLARVTPKQLLESCLRMKPDRILLAELRAEEAFDYLRNVNSGHPGLHHQRPRRQRRTRLRAAGAAGQAKSGRTRSRARATSRACCYLLIDVVIQFGVESHERFIKEIWYDPERKRAARSAAGAHAERHDARLVGALLPYAAVQAPMVGGLDAQRGRLAQAPAIAARCRAVDRDRGNRACALAGAAAFRIGSGAARVRAVRLADLACAALGYAGGRASRSQRRVQRFTSAGPSSRRSGARADRREMLASSSGSQITCGRGDPLRWPTRPNISS